MQNVNNINNPNIINVGNSINFNGFGNENVHYPYHEYLSQTGESWAFVNNVYSPQRTFFSLICLLPPFYGHFIKLLEWNHKCQPNAHCNEDLNDPKTNHNAHLGENTHEQYIQNINIMRRKKNRFLGVQGYFATSLTT